MVSVPSMRAGPGLACASLMFLALYGGGEGGAGASAQGTDGAMLNGSAANKPGPPDGQPAHAEDEQIDGVRQQRQPHDDLKRPRP